MKYLFFLFTLIIVFTINAQDSNADFNSAVYSPQVVHADNNRYTYTYDWWGNVTSILHEMQIAGDWLLYGKKEYTYNGSGHLTSYSELAYNNNSWLMYMRDLFTPNFSGYPLSIVRQVLDNNILINSDRKNYTYSGGGDVATFVQEFWENNSWRNNSRNTYTYAAPGKVQIDLRGIWDTLAGEWVDKARYVYTYSGGNGFSSRVNQSQPPYGNEWFTLDSLFRTYSGNNITSETLLFNVNNYAWWQNEYRFTYTYDGAGNMLSFSREFSHYLAPSSWTNDWIRYYTYNSGNRMTTQRILLWNGTGWRNHMRWEYAYDISGNNTEAVYYSGSQNLWTMERKATYTYDTYGNTLTGLAWIYNAGQWSAGWTDLQLVFNNRQDTLAYNSVMSVSAEYVTELEDDQLPVSSFSLFQNYPNPFNPETVISYQISVNSHVTLKLFDVLGNEVATLVNEEKEAGYHNYQLSIVNYQLTSGVYFYKLQADDFISLKKMIVLK